MTYNESIINILPVMSNTFANHCTTHDLTSPSPLQKQRFICDILQFQR